MSVTKPQAQALAAFIARIRDDWDHPGIVAAIMRAAPLGTAADIGVGLCRLAGNAELRTPATLAEPGPHWRDAAVGKLNRPDMCPDHPSEKAGNCRHCVAASVPAPSTLAAARAELAKRERLRPNQPRQQKPADLSSARTRADQEATA